MKKILIAVGLVLVMATSALAINKGQSELNLYGAIGETTTKAKGASSQTSDDFTTRIGYGYFFTDAFSLGADIDYNYSKSQGSSDGTNTIYTLLTTKYHFMPKNTLVPYIGAQLGGYFMDAGSNLSSTGFAYGALGGIKYFLTENASINAELNFLGMSTTTKASGRSYDADMTRLQAMFGLSYYFGK